MLKEIAPPEYVIFNHLTQYYDLGGEYYIIKSSKNILLLILLLWNFNLKDMKPRIYYITHWRRNKNQATRGTINFIMTIIFYKYCSSTFRANSYLFNIIFLFCAHVYLLCNKIIKQPKEKEISPSKLIITPNPRGF